MKKNILLITLFLILHNTLLAQDKSLQNIISENTTLLTVDSNGFQGEGWNLISESVKRSNNVLIGEEHFTNEIPLFTKRIFDIQKFDNFYIEIDPYSTKIIEESIKLPNEERATFNKRYKDLFSFYALNPEYELLKDIVDSGVNLLGSDQVVMYADRLIFQDLLKITDSFTAKEIYEEIIKKSDEHLKAFFENPQNPMYLITPEFSKKIKALQKLKLSKKEDKILDAMLKSVDIYQSGVKGHPKRVTLLKHHVMQDYNLWKDKKNLFKYGANHLTKGESLLTLYDIGNLVSNISEANGKTALHILIIGQSGMLGQPFKIFPPKSVDDNSWPLKNLKPFLTANENNWKVFDLKNIKKALKKEKLNVDDITLNRVIKGYDILVVIPEVTAAKF